MTGAFPAPASISSPLGHAHEMLTGFALAVVAGHQLPPMTRMRAGSLFGLWAAARFAFLALPLGVAFAFDAAFAIVLALNIAPRLFRAAKKLRNQGLPAVLTILCLGAVAFDVAMLASGIAALRTAAVAIVLSLAALMLFMGGRVIAPAAAGQLYRQGGSLSARVQPRIEGALLVVMAAALVFAVWPDGDVPMRVACAAAGVLALVRLLRWRLWACRGRPDLLCLGAGYAWLGLGLLAAGATEPGLARTAAWHLITIGALGTLTQNVMAQTLLLKARRAPAAEWIPSAATALVAAATVLRVTAAFVDAHATALLIAAAACWSIAFVALAHLLARSLAEFAKRTRMPHEPAG